MLRIAKLTDYATVLMAHLARSPQRQVSAQQLASELGLPAPTVATLLKRLTRAGLVSSVRGAGGGYLLARAHKDISVADVITAIEGPVALTECALGTGSCSFEASCATRGNWRLISRAVQVALESVSLADMATDMTTNMAVPVRRTIPARTLRKQALTKQE
jgi:FeS assembly SUF system regulator